MIVIRTGAPRRSCASCNPAKPAPTMTTLWPVMSGSGRRPDPDPAPLAAGAVDRLHQGLDPQPRPEAERLRHLPRHGVEIAGDLDRLQVVEPELVPGGDAEPPVGRMLGPGLDA